jgi:hypothetical protein
VVRSTVRRETPAPARFEAIAAVLLKIRVSFDVTLFRLVDVSKGRIYFGLLSDGEDSTVFRNVGDSLSADTT